MIFLDANVFVHYVGREHRLRHQARALVERLIERRERIVTSAEVLQEVLHYYLRDQRLRALDDAFTLVKNCVDEIWPVDQVDIETARNLISRYPGLEARDLVHLACCIRRDPHELMTFDRGLAAAWQSRS